MPPNAPRRENIEIKTYPLRGLLISRIGRNKNMIKTTISSPDLPAAIQGESDDIIRKRKKKILLWGILWAVFPPVLLFVLLAAIT